MAGQEANPCIWILGHSTHNGNMFSLFQFDDMSASRMLQPKEELVYSPISLKDYLPRYNQRIRQQAHEFILFVQEKIFVEVLKEANFVSCNVLACCKFQKPKSAIITVQPTTTNF